MGNTYWDYQSNNKVPSKKADAFIKELIELYKKHDIVLSHEDTQGSFILCPLDEQHIRWIQDTNIDFTRSNK